MSNFLLGGVYIMYVSWAGRLPPVLIRAGSGLLADIR